MKTSELEELLARISRYGEACYDYGLADPCNHEQCVRLGAAKQKAWDAVVKKLKNVTLEN